MEVLPNNTLLPSVKMMMNVRTRRIPFLSPVREEVIGIPGDIQR